MPEPIDSALSLDKSFVFLSGTLECLQAVRGVYCSAKQLELRSIEPGPKQKIKQTRLEFYANLIQPNRLDSTEQTGKRK